MEGLTVGWGALQRAVRWAIVCATVLVLLSAAYCNAGCLTDGEAAPATCPDAAGDVMADAATADGCGQLAAVWCAVQLRCGGLEGVGPDRWNECVRVFQCEDPAPGGGYAWDPRAEAAAWAVGPCP